MESDQYRESITLHRNASNRKIHSEETAPDGYLVAKDVEFEVKDTCVVQHVTMVDEENS